MPYLRSHSWKEAVAAFEKAGFEVMRITGDHIVMWGPDAMRPVIIPKVKALPAFIVQNNLRTAGITKKKYRELLAKKKGK